MIKKSFFLLFLLFALSTKTEGQIEKNLFSKKININDDFFDKTLGKKTIVFFFF